MAKNPTSSDDPKGPPAAVAEAEPLEIPVVDPEDKEFLQGFAVPDEAVEGAEEKAEKVEVPKAEAKKAEPKPKVEPAKAEVKVEPEPKKVESRPLTPIERAERDKRKKYAELWQQAEEEKERLQARIAQLQGQPKPAEFKVGVAKLPEERLRAMRERLKSATDLDVVAEAAVREAEALMQERDQRWQEALQAREQQWQAQTEQRDLLNKIGLSWLDAKIAHADFSQVLQKSGVLDLITERNGTYADPYLARRVYLAANPGEEAYRLAVGRLEFEAGKNGTDLDAAEEPVKTPVKETPKATATVEPEPEEEAERRGARKVIEQVESIAKKPKGIAGLKSAGEVKTRWSREELDALQKRYPDRYEQLVQRYPEVLRYHLS